MDSRVVPPASKQLPISNGDWLRVKTRLTAGENKRMVKRGSTEAEDGRRFDSIEAGTAKILAYLLDWSLTDPAGAVIAIARQPDDVVEAALDSIDPESYTEILRAIEAHEIAMQAERDAQKKIPPGDPTSLPLSSSPEPAASPTTGCAT